MQPSLSPSASLAQHWCTGKDSNLRTSLGGTDLQSVGFNHSPTCAKPQTEGLSFRQNATNLRTTQTSNFQQALHRRTFGGRILLNPIGKFSMEVAVGKSLCRH